MTKYEKALDLGRLLAAVGVASASMAACVYFAPASIGGRPVSFDVLMAGYMVAVGGPAMTIVLSGILGWLAKLAPAGTASLPLPKGEQVLYRTLSLAFGGAPMAWGLFVLVDWYRGGSGLPDTWLYLSCGLQLLTYVLAIAAVVVLGRRRQREDLAPMA